MSHLFDDILHEASKSSVLDTGDLNAASLLILRSAIKGLKIKRASIWLLSPERQSLACRLLIDLGDSQCSDIAVLKREEYPHYFAALDRERAIVAHNTATDPVTSELIATYLNPLRISSMLNAPIRHLGVMIGLICCEHQGEIREWLTTEITFVSALANLYGRAISAEQRNNYEQQLHQINEQLEVKVKERTEWLENALRSLTHTQAKLIESEKLASIGRMVSGLAHEINTPLGIAVTSASHCESELKRMQELYIRRELYEEDFQKFLTVLSEGINLVSGNLLRAANLVQNFKLTGAIQTAPEEEVFELRNCINIIIKSLQPLLKQHTLTCHFSSEEPIHLNSYPGAVAQIITNLVTNSIHHGFSDLQKGEINIFIAAQDELVKLSYSDNGSGIAEKIEDKIFEPFFTTARKTGGSGLGLSIVYNLVTQQLKGKINIESQPEAGVTFTITFPKSVKKQ